MSKSKHIHRLRRHSYKNGEDVYFCTLPDCKFKSIPALQLGKRSICNRCEKEFFLNEYSIRLAKPHCPDCHQSKDGSVASISSGLISSISSTKTTTNQPKQSSNDTLHILPKLEINYDKDTSDLRDRLNKALEDISDPEELESVSSSDISDQGDDIL